MTAPTGSPAIGPMWPSCGSPGETGCGQAIKRTPATVGAAMVQVAMSRSEDGPLTPEEIVRATIELSANLQRPVYRGQAVSDWQPESGAVRRLRDGYGKEFPVDEDEIRRLVNEYHRRQLINPMKLIDGDDLDDLQRLSVLQHQGAATGFLDFTESILVALWFASSAPFDKDARVFVLDIGDENISRDGRHSPTPFRPRSITMYYEPDRSLGMRIISQKSVFVICNPRIPEKHLKSLIVPKDSKEALQKYLEDLGLSQQSLFNDIGGLAIANSVTSKFKPTQPMMPQYYRDVGNLDYEAGRYDDALDAYEAYAEVLPNVAEPHGLKGDVLAFLGRFEEADLAYTNAIKNLDRPFSFGEQAIVHPQFQEAAGGLMHHNLHYNRGNVRAAIGNHSEAITDFDTALGHSKATSPAVLKNRGNSKFAMQRFSEAYQDFEVAFQENEESGAALAMGNCKVMLGEFRQALQQFFAGSTCKPEGTAAHCRANAGQLSRLLDALDRQDFKVRREGGIVIVETAHLQGSQFHFPFTGNQGNAPNMASGLASRTYGSGYEGMNGFAVVIDLPNLYAEFGTATRKSQEVL